MLPQGRTGFLGSGGHFWRVGQCCLPLTGQGGRASVCWGTGQTVLVREPVQRPSRDEFLMVRDGHAAVHARIDILAGSSLFEERFGAVRPARQRRRRVRERRGLSGGGCALAAAVEPVEPAAAA